MALPTYGTMAVDWNSALILSVWRRERLARAKALLAKSEMGALLCFDMKQCALLDSDAHRARGLKTK